MQIVNGIAKKTFRQLFIEATNKEKLDIELLDKNICHSFVLKHKNNRIVTKYETAGLVLVYTDI